MSTIAEMRKMDIAVAQKDFAEVEKLLACGYRISPKSFNFIVVNDLAPIIDMIIDFDVHVPAFALETAIKTSRFKTARTFIAYKCGMSSKALNLAINCKCAEIVADLLDNGCPATRDVREFISAYTRGRCMYTNRQLANELCDWPAPPRRFQ